MSTAIADPAQPLPRREVTLVLDPDTHAELLRAADGADLAAHLRSLAGRYARWCELRDWLVQLETAYGPLPPEALERMHRQMLGLARRASSAPATLTLGFDPEEFAALGAAARCRPLADYAREVLIEHLTAAPGAASDAASPGSPPD
ncbi:hypothetical protein CLV63_101325 [Murinocardiopsis flavida]|uniref:Uncharacterized protein n=1 Tax=Murinocardiopsis flavida TaxID=645275 RepID=A0A2P8DUF1_9ACTN|nr:hypothetical protein [Murinocardiopsis flavida]PSL00847.1 hypothetical protein CLV63_101325 [Murinocardiopsis flavida]